LLSSLLRLILLDALLVLFPTSLLFLLVLLHTLLVLFPALLLFSPSLFLVLANALAVLLPALVLLGLLCRTLSFTLLLLGGALLLARLAVGVATSFLFGAPLIALALVTLISLIRLLLGFFAALSAAAATPLRICDIGDADQQCQSERG
jgi:hypothetical protein